MSPVSVRYEDLKNIFFAVEIPRQTLHPKPFNNICEIFILNEPGLPKTTPVMEKSTHNSACVARQVTISTITCILVVKVKLYQLKSS